MIIYLNNNYTFNQLIMCLYTYKKKNRESVCVLCFDIFKNTSSSKKKTQPISILQLLNTRQFS
jgi:hypothetical protein